MGIQGLLPLLKSIQKPVSLKKFSGETVGVDAYGWLHRGTIACAMELATGKPTRKFVDFAMHRVRMLQHFGVIPYIVFDGDYLPSKAITEIHRAKKRDESKKLGLELQRAGKVADAYQELQKAIDVTPEMARQFIDELKKAGVQYVVAPYEADAQLVYLERQGIISAILSDDSDLLVFGAKCLLTKLDQYGECIEINKSQFCACREVSLTGWSDVEFRQMAILSGCDYLRSINGMGLKTAYRLIRKHKTVEKVIRMVEFDGKFSVPKGYLQDFRQAELTFLHQWVFCPKQNKLVFHTEPRQPLDPKSLPFIGAYVEPEIAQKVACGDLNPITKQLIISKTSISTPSNRASATKAPATRTFTAARSSNTMATVMTTPRQRDTQTLLPRTRPAGRSVSIEEFFRPQRIPLGEMPVSDFVLTPNQGNVLAGLANITRGGTIDQESENREREPERDRVRSILIPLPRNYLLPQEITPPPTQATPTSSILSRGRSTSSTHSTSDLPSAKRARLCSDDMSPDLPSSSSSQSRSRFFASTVSNESPAVGKSGKRRGRKSKTDVGIFSDDSIEEAFASIPDNVLNEVTSKNANGLDLDVLHSGEGSGVQGESSMNSQIFGASSVCTGQAPPTPIDTPTTSFAVGCLGHFSLASTPSGSSKAATRSVFVNGLPTPPSQTSKCPLTVNHHNGNANMSSKPLGGLQSVLQRLGARALVSANMSPTIPKPLAKRIGVPFPEVARTKHLKAVSIIEAACQIPLPAVDKEEADALLNEDVENQVQLGGSEDSIIHDSEEEEDELTEKPKLNLARFAFAG